MRVYRALLLLLLTSLVNIGCFITPVRCFEYIRESHVWDQFLNSSDSIISINNDGFYSDTYNDFHSSIYSDSISDSNVLINNEDSNIYNINGNNEVLNSIIKKDHNPINHKDHNIINNTANSINTMNKFNIPDDDGFNSTTSSSNGYTSEPNSTGSDKDEVSSHVTRETNSVLPSLRRSSSSQTEILGRLLRGYDVNEWPHSYYGKRTDVHVQMFINSFGSLNAVGMDFRIDLFLRQTWQDPRLAYSDKRKYLTLMESKVQKKIWRPDTYFDNVKEAKIHQVTLPNVMLRIGKMGDILYSMRFTLLLSCYMNFQDFPFDIQECDSVIASFASTKDMVSYHWYDKNPIMFPDDLEIAEFDLLSNSTVETTLHFATGHFSGLIARFTLRRQNGHHILQTYVPTILIVSISWVSFWLDPTAVPGRITLGVTTLLTLTTLATGVRQILPPISYVKAIDVWVGMCMVMVFGALLEFTIVNWLATTKVSSRRKRASILSSSLSSSSSDIYIGAVDDSDDAAGWGGIGASYPPVNTQSTGSGKPPTVTHMKAARIVDRISRAMFPAIFFLFNIFYWPYYIFMQYGETSREMFS
uniref:Glycine receptor subunit alphaZ1-like n=1 Tax=Hirondellea gigas TaxID=1518452 RepID=A0A2P2IAN3_9CRUS